MLAAGSVDAEEGGATEEESGAADELEGGDTRLDATLADAPEDSGDTDDGAEDVALCADLLEDVATEEEVEATDFEELDGASDLEDDDCEDGGGGAGLDGGGDTAAGELGALELEPDSEDAFEDEALLEDELECAEVEEPAGGD